MIQLNNVESVKHFILSDFGFTYTLEHNFDSEIKSGALKVLPTALGQASIGLILMKNRNKVESPSVSLLSQLIIEELSNPKEEFKDFYTKTLFEIPASFTQKPLLELKNYSSNCCSILYELREKAYLFR